MASKKFATALRPPLRAPGFPEIHSANRQSFWSQARSRVVVSAFASGMSTVCRDVEANLC